MLEHLEIRNFALIEHLSVDFSEGFNVITGETGAGKSIILGALGLLMGERADTSAVRSGCDEIVINAVVSIPEDHEILPWLEEKGVIPEDGAIYIKRTVKANGSRSLIHVQNQLFTRQDLATLADSIIDMHGQSEHQSLLSSENQRKILDSYANNEELLKLCNDSYRQILELNKQKEDIVKQLEEGQRQADYLHFALEEIDSAKIVVGEDEEIKAKVQVLGQYETIYEYLNLCTDKLKEAKSTIYDALTYCAKAAKCDASLADFTARLESTRIEAEDIAASLRDYLGSVDYSEAVINSLQDRLSVLQKLKRKYGPNLEDVLGFAERARTTLDITENSEEHLKMCEANIIKAKEQYNSFAEKLHKSRNASAKELKTKIQAVLRSLGMPDAIFDIVLNECKATSHGTDSVAFMISANPGESAKLLNNIASGGELSRVMLSLKTVLAKADAIQTQVFDEVDSGIGGSVALSLASCIKDLAKTKQVIAITHLASIASAADNQMVVSKTVQGGRTYTHLRHVKGEERVHEIARMLSGDESEVSLEHARKMIAN
ncbi:MAG: DNA repair protein RecN [Sphaerochaetaceae bacterium]|nr:DNA repair protein RecN [Sphaerochaetaceae bacterium]